MKYQNSSGNSNIVEFSNDPNYTSIRVKFQDGSTYLYTDDSCGLDTVQEMIGLGLSGSGLNAFISKNRPSYERKD